MVFVRMLKWWLKPVDSMIISMKLDKARLHMRILFFALIVGISLLPAQLLISWLGMGEARWLFTISFFIAFTFLFTVETYLIENPYSDKKNV